jgi:hypothetical protein
MSYLPAKLATKLVAEWTAIYMSYLPAKLAT